MKSKNGTNAKVRSTVMHYEQANASPYWSYVNRAGNIYDNSESLVVERCHSPCITMFIWPHLYSARANAY